MTKSLDRWLREMLHERTADASGPAGPQGPSDKQCLDAETLAGWFDDALTPRVRAVAEGHVADCARCQAFLAAMVRTAPAPVVQPFWRPIYSRLLIPLGVAAAGALIWVSVPQRTTVRPEAVNARAEIKPEGAVPDEVTTPSPAAAPSAPAVPSQALRDRATSAESAERRALPREGAAQANDVTAPAERVAAAAPGVAVPPAVAAPAAVEETTRQAAPAAVSESVTVVESMPAATPQRPTPTVEQMRTALRSAVARELVVVSSDASTRWRLAAVGVVQRSTDGGITWESHSTGVPLRPTAGASPSPSVCWLVGPRGIVLLTTDGRSWQRVPFAEQVDLIAIGATDDMSATVITADGRRFVTTNRGRSWERQQPDR